MKTKSLYSQLHDKLKNKRCSGICSTLLFQATLLVLIGAGWSNAFAQNLLSNPGFESGLSSWKTNTIGFYGAYTTPAPVQGGTNQLFLQASAGQSPLYSFVYQDVACGSNHAFTASVWARDYAAYAQTMELGLQFYNASNTYLTGAVAQVVSTAYTQMVASAVAPAGTAKARVVLLVYSTASLTGAANFDDASLVVTSNAAPVANPDSLSWGRYLSSKAISISSLLANDTDADGDPRSLISVDATSANGVTLSNIGGYILYNGALTNNDSFNYTISDGLGGTSSALVSIMVDSNIVGNAELLNNPGFETGDFSSWTKSPQGVFGVYNFPAPVHGGTYQAYVQSSFNVTPNYAFIVQDVTGTSNHIYTASVWARDYAAYARTMQLGVEFHGAGGYISQAFQQMVSTTYTQMIASAVAPVGTTKVRITLLIYSTTSATGVANFDDASLVMSNTPPVAQSIATNAFSGTPLSMQIIGGMYAPTDAEADSVTVVAVNYTSGNGASVGYDATNITYTASPSFTGTDSFDYVVTDGFGGYGTNTVTVNVTANIPAQSSLTITNMAGTNYLKCVGVPGASYALEETPSLAPASWTPIVTNTASGAGEAIFDLATTNGASFYRTRQVAP